MAGRRSPTTIGITCAGARSNRTGRVTPSARAQLSTAEIHSPSRTFSEAAARRRAMTWSATSRARSSRAPAAYIVRASAGQLSRGVACEGTGSVGEPGDATEDVADVTSVVVESDGA